MTTKRESITPAVEQQLEKEERAKIIVARVKSNKKFMAGIRESVEGRLRGEPGTRLQDLKRKNE